MSKRKNSLVSILLWVVVAFLLFLALAIALQGLLDIGEVFDVIDEFGNVVTDEFGNVVTDFDENFGTSTGDVRIENLKMYSAYATSGSRNFGYYGFLITDLNSNTTYSLYFSLLDEHGFVVNIIDVDGSYYYSEDVDGGYGNYDEDISRYGVGAFKLRSDVDGVLTLFCVYNSESYLFDSSHETNVGDIFNLYIVVLYMTEDDPSEPSFGFSDEVIFTSIKTLYFYILFDNFGTSGSTSSGSITSDHFGGGSVYVLDGNYLMRETLTVSKDLQALFEDFDNSESYEFYDYTDFKCCIFLFEDCEGYDGTQYYGMRFYYYEGDIDLFYEISKSETLVYDQSFFKALEYRYLYFDEVEVSEAFYLFIIENSTKVS